MIGAHRREQWPGNVPCSSSYQVASTHGQLHQGIDVAGQEQLELAGQSTLLILVVLTSSSRTRNGPWYGRANLHIFSAGLYKNTLLPSLAVYTSGRSIVSGTSQCTV